MNIWNNTVSLLGGIAFLAMTNATVSAQTCDGVTSTLPPEMGEFQHSLFQFDWTDIPVSVPAWSPVGSETLVKATVSFELEVSGQLSFTNNSGTVCVSVPWTHTTDYAATAPFTLPGFPIDESTEDLGFFTNISVGGTETQDSDFALIFEGPFEFKDSDASPFIGNPGDELTFLTDVTGLFFAAGCSPGLAQTDLAARVKVTVQYMVCTSDPGGGGDPEGCTPGYWKNHTERWDGIGGDDATISVHWHDAFNMFFGVTPAQSGHPNTATMLDAASTGGGGRIALGRHAVAGAASSDAGINYAYALGEVIAIYRDGVGADPGPLGLSSAKDLLEAANEAGCPLGNGNGDPEITPYCFGDEGNCLCDGFLGGGGCMHSGGQGALLSGSGSVSTVTDDLVLTTSQMPLNAFSMTFMGPQSASIPFGNGRLCVSPAGGKMFRYRPALNSGPGGMISLGPGIVAHSQLFTLYGGSITPGSTWYFQTYFRDVGPNCSSSFNLSNAVRVDFTL